MATSESDLNRSGLFPLPLTLFEEFLLADQRPGFPITFVIQLKFSGRVERAAFEQAVRTAVARHPLLSASVKQMARYTHRWVLTEEATPIHWSSLSTADEDAPLGDGYGEPVDLSREAGLSIWVRQGDERSEVRLQFHHACCDGIGGFRFVEDLLVAYAAQTGGEATATLADLDVARLAVRGHFGLAPRPWRQRLRETIFGAKEALRLYREKPLSIAIPRESQRDTDAQERTESASDDGRPSAGGSLVFASQRFSGDMLRKLRVAATDANATLNDLLLHDLFLALREWNARHDADRGERYLRIVMPQSLRERADASMPAANVMSYSFLTRRTDACRAGDELMGGLAWETAAIRKYRLALYFIGGLAVGHRWKFLMKWGLSDRHCFATAVMTNVGDPTRRFRARFPRTDGRIHVGNLVLDDITGVPPLRPMTRAAFSITTYARQLTVSVMCDGTVMNHDDAQGLLDCFVSRLEGRF